MSDLPPIHDDEPPATEPPATEPPATEPPATELVGDDAAGEAHAHDAHDDEAPEAPPVDAAAALPAAQQPPPSAPAAPSPPARPAPPTPIDEPPQIAAEASRVVRCFLAVNFPVVTVRRIADEIAALKGPVSAAGLQVRWVPAANLHLTLKFLGPVRAPVVEAIRTRLRAALADARPFEIEALGLGAFPSLAEGKPRILWAGVRQDAALAALQQLVEGVTTAMGFPSEERPFHPHVTIGRVTGGQGDPEKLAALLSERGGRVFGVGRVTEVVIYESRTLSRGAEYHALHRVGLSI